MQRRCQWWDPYPQAERAHAALLFQLQDRVSGPAGPQNRLHVLLRLRVVHEDDVQILLPQRLPALLQRGEHRGTVVAPLHPGTGPHLGRDAEGSPLRGAQTAQGDAQAAFGRAPLVQRRGVDVVDSQLHGPAHRSGGDLATLRRTGVAIPDQTQGSSAKPQHGQLHVEPPEAPARQAPGQRLLYYAISLHAGTVAHAPPYGSGVRRPEASTMACLSGPAAGSYDPAT